MTINTILPFLLVAFIVLLESTEWDSINNRLSRRFDKLKATNKDVHVSTNKTISYDRGYVLCAANFMIPDLIRTLYELRITWNSKLPIAIMHCEEIYADNYALIKYFQPIEIINLCPEDNEQVFGMDRGSAMKRLRGFFCIVASLIQSPFKETMYMDMDTIWVKHPELLFESRIYKQRGALFFRDRPMYVPSYNYDGSLTTNNQNLVDLFQTYHIPLNKSYVRQQYFSHGISQWWRVLRPFWNDSFVFSKDLGIIIVINKH